VKSIPALLCAILFASPLLTVHSHAAEPQGQAPFVLSSTDGRSFSLPEQQEGIAIYFFWASWCPYCRALMPHLQSLKDELGDDLTIYALNFRDDEDPQAYIDRSGFDFIVFPNADEVAQQWQVQGTPGLFLLDRNRQLRLNLLDVMAASEDLPESLNHAQRAQRRAPYWAAKIRLALDEILDGPED
jgi:thiol-disulfide isomerase/thioredoxin